MTTTRIRLATGRRALQRLAIGAASALLIFTSPSPALATTSGAQPDPAWDFGRGGEEVPGQPACYLPAPNVTERKMYSMARPACEPGHMQ